MNRVRRVLALRRSVDDFAARWRAIAERPGDLLYVALGDSAAQGIGASDPELGYVGLVAAHLSSTAARAVRVVNLSVSGARAADVVRVQMPRLREFPRADVVTLAIGGNDVRHTTPEEFATSLREIIAGLPAGTLVADVPDFGPRLGVRSRALSEIVRGQLSERPDLVPVQLEAATRTMRWGDYAADFFHPGPRGHRIWAAPFIERLPDRR